jgi:hypothetical protein
MCLVGSIVIASTSLAGDERKTVPARQPLTYKDSGIYGWWQPYFWEGPYDFVITQAIILPGDFGPTKVTNNCSTVENIKEWNQSLLKARAAGKRVIVVVSPGQGQPYEEPYYKALEQFLANINYEELYAITLGEENVSEASWVAALSDFYHRIKKKYPDLPVYQWYTCSSRSTARPGFLWPLLPSDGWLSDEYVSSPDDFEQAVRRYRMIGLPYVNIIWAAPYYSSSKQTSVQFHQSIFDGHLRVSQKYNVPTAYFCWDGPAAGRTFPWDENGQQENKDLYKTIMSNIAKLKSIPDESLLDWDRGEIPAKTVLKKTGDNLLAFRESFDLWIDKDFKPADPDFMDRSDIRGLRHMRWNANPSLITVCGDASLLNHWITPDGEKCQFKASAVVSVEPGAKCDVILEVSPNGYDWGSRTNEIKDGVMSVQLPGNQSQIYTRLRISGTERGDAKPLASIDWIEVQGTQAK